MKVRFNEKAQEDLRQHQKIGRKAVLKKIVDLIEAIRESPYSGLGKPEALKHELTGFWSRRINREHRIIYKVFEKENIVEIHSLKGHY